eukprot:EG_transcript_21424
MLALYVAFLVNQMLWKFPLMAEAREKKERFNRYADPRMLPADRLVANTLEWLPVFLGLFWLSTVLTTGQTTPLGWAYVAFRALYAVLVLRGGIRPSGIKLWVLAATIPMYLVLACLLGSVLVHVL